MNKEDIRETHCHFTDNHEIFYKEIYGVNEDFSQEYILKITCIKCNFCIKIYDKEEINDDIVDFFNNYYINKLYDSFISVGR